jgi:hypothetical protein
LGVPASRIDRNNALHWDGPAGTRRRIDMATRLLPALLALMALLAWTVPAQAHSGLGGYHGGPRLEGEDYDTPDAGCDPDFDGEHTMPSGPAPGGHAFLPHSGCGINHDDLCFASSADIDSVTVRVGGIDGAMTYTVRVLVDGAHHGQATFTQSHSDGFVQHDVDSPWYSIPAGVHDVRIEYTVASGPFYANLDIDFASIFHSGSNTCSGTAVLLCPIFAAAGRPCPA